MKPDPSWQIANMVARYLPTRGCDIIGGVISLHIDEAVRATHRLVLVLRKAFELAAKAYQQGQLEDSLAQCDRLRQRLRKQRRELRPQEWNMHLTLSRLEGELFLLRAACLHKMGRTNQAITILQELLDLHPEEPTVHLNLSMLLLHSGDFSEGWRQYEWRHQDRHIDRSIPNLPAPQWQGEDLTGKTILILSEQGFGDCIQFARYLPIVKAQAKRLIFACLPALVPLFENEPYVDELTQRVDANTQYDFYLPICSLAGRFGANPTNIPSPQIFGNFKTERDGYWAQRLADTGIQVGIAWSVGALKDDVNRSANLQDFLCLLNVPEINLYSLQLHDPIEGMPERFYQLGTELRDFGDTAAVVRHLDLVICIDTALAHIALSMGCETWVVLPMVEDWRWVSYPAGGNAGKNDNSPGGSIWYPEAKLFKQHNRWDWQGVMTEVAEALQERMAADS